MIYLNKYVARISLRVCIVEIYPAQHNLFYRQVRII